MHYDMVIIIIVIFDFSWYNNINTIHSPIRRSIRYLYYTIVINIFCIVIS